MTVATAVPITPPADRWSHLLKPAARLGAIAFAVGFMGCLALRAEAIAPSPDGAVAVEPAIDTPPVSDEWNLPKHV